MTIGKLICVLGECDSLSVSFSIFTMPVILFSFCKNKIVIEPGTYVGLENYELRWDFLLGGIRAVT